MTPGRPDLKLIPPRKVLETILWILNTGAQWHMPRRAALINNAYRRPQVW